MNAEATTESEFAERETLAGNGIVMARAGSTDRVARFEEKTRI